MKVFITAFLLLPFLIFGQTKNVAYQDPYPPPEKVAKDFKQLLQRPLVNPRPSFQTVTTDSVIMEKGFFYSEANEKVPVLIFKPVKKATAYPVVICLHGTGGNKDEKTIKDLLYQCTQLGFMGVAIDARYHGERINGGANKAQQYNEAIIRAWKKTDTQHPEYPFFFDTVYDLWRLTDYLTSRKDVQANRIGMMGISMGGIETWMAASVDKRIKVAVPVIAAQSFKWSIENNSWQGRANTIGEAHRQVAKDLGDSTVNKENVIKLWAKLLPGITGEFDCPSMLRLFAPRPLLLLNNEKDQNCPLPGARIAFETVTHAYEAKKASNRLQIHVTPNEPHRFLPEQAQMAMAWFKKWL